MNNFNYWIGTTDLALLKEVQKNRQIKNRHNFFWFNDFDSKEEYKKETTEFKTIFFAEIKVNPNCEQLKNLVFNSLTGWPIDLYPEVTILRIEKVDNNLELLND